MNRGLLRTRSQRGRVHGSNASAQADNAALDTHGGVGLAAEYDVERANFARRGFTQVASINNILILAFMGQENLGLPKGY